jgi:hypothetical protein
MKIIMVSIICSFVCAKCFAQRPKIFLTYLSGGYSQTVYDRTKQNNLWGIEAGIQTTYNGTGGFKPTIELTYIPVLLNDYVYRMNADGSEIPAVGSVLNLFAGTAFYPVKNLFVAFAPGLGFISGRILPAIKPSIGLHFPKNKRWVAKAAFTNIFNRDKVTKADFGSLSFSLGIKLF